MRQTFGKFFSTVFLAALMLLTVFLVSCDSPSIMPPEEKSTVGSLYIEPAVDKSLIWTANTEISEYVYKATPLFSGTATGSASDWQHLSFTGSGTVGQLTQGRWFFELQGRNSKGTTVTVGSSETYIEAGKENAVSIQMKTDPTLGVGTVKYNVWIQNVSEKGSILKVYDKPVGESAFNEINTHSDVSETNPHITGSIAGMKAGYHEMLFMLFDADGAALGGEQIGLQVVTNEVTTISGIVEPSLEIEFEISIKSMGYIHAVLFPSDGVTVEGEGRDQTAYIERGDVVSFTWKDLDDATSHPTEWIWALDGEVIENSTKSYSVSYTEYGEHELSVIGIRRDENGVAWDCGSAVIRIVVVRHVCEITFMADGGFFPDGTDIAVMYMDTTIEAERKIPGGNPFDGLSPQKTGYRLSAWIDADTEEEVVTIAEDGTVTFLPAFVTKQQTRKLKAVWIAGTYTATVIWDNNVYIGGKAVNYSEEYTIKSGESLTAFLVEKPVRQGFTFLGYTTEENGRGDKVEYNGTYIWGKDITIWANWEYIPITISYYKSFSDYENGVAGYKSTLVGSDLRYGSLPQPLRQGKVFKGWAHPEDLDMTQYEVVDGVKYLWQDALNAGKNYVQVTDYVKKYYDHSLIAVWGEGNIKISFNTGDAELTEKGVESISQFSVDDNGVYYTLGALGTQYGALPFTDIETEVRAGMEFMGWYDSATYNVRVYEVSAVTTNADHTLYAKWEGAKIKVSFETGNGTVLEDKEVRYLGTYGVLPELVRAGYDFGGWTYNDEVVTAESTVKATASHTLVAKWIPHVSSLTLDIAGGTYTGSTSLKLDYEAAYKTATDADGNTFGDSSTSSGLKEPVREGYDFGGWYTNPAGNGTAITGDTINKVSSAQVLYATWKAHTFTITFYNNWPDVSETKGKAATSTKTNIPFGTSYGDLPMLSVTGYTFNGWYTALSGGTRVSSSTRYDVDKDISLYARWSVTTINISFYEDGVVCRDEEGNALSPVQREYGKKYSPLPTPYKFGYTFTGRWTLVGRTDSDGNPIYITDSMAVEYVDDITLSPEWTAEKILVIVTSSITSSEKGEISAIDWTGVKTYEVSYGDSFSTARSATIRSGKWTAGAQTSLPTYTKVGYKQKEWAIVVSGKSRTRANETAYLLDYAGMEALGKKKYGTVTPDRVVYMAPDWQADTFYTEYVNYVETDNGFEKTDKAPSKQSVAIDYDETLGEVLGEDSSTWVLEWTGYGCAGYYSDEAMTKELSPDSVVGTDIVANSGGKIVIYCKWQKIRVRIEVDTDDYYETRDEHFYVADILSGSSNGLYSGADGWYDFSGTINDRTYTKLRKGSESLTLVNITGTGYSGWSAPADMTMRVIVKSSVYQISERCTVCYGAGYKSMIGSGSEEIVSIDAGESTGENAPTADRITDTTTIHYWANYMYDFCPSGCKSWTHLTDSESVSYKYGKWVVCPNCNGQYLNCRTTKWETGTESGTCSKCDGTGEVTCTKCDGTGETTSTTTCSKCGGTGEMVLIAAKCLSCKGAGCESCGNTGYNPVMGECSSCGGSGSKSSTTSCPTTKPCSNCKGTGKAVETYATWTDKRCYCEYQSEAVGGVYKPGYIWLSGYRLNAYKPFNLSIRKNGSELLSDSSLTGGLLQMFAYSLTEGDYIYIAVTDVKGSTNMLVDKLSTGYLVLADKASEFPSLALCGSGTGAIMPLDYNHYELINTRYALSNGYAKTSRTTPYYSYSGLVNEVQYADTLGNKKVKTLQSDIGLVTSDQIDSSQPMEFSVTLYDGTVKSGTISNIAWSDKTLSITYSGGLFEWEYRPANGSATLPLVKSLKLYCWLKPEAE